MSSRGSITALLVCAFCLCVPGLALSQTYVSEEDPKEYVECPEGYKCVPEEAAERIRKTLELHQCMEQARKRNNGDLQLTHSEYRIVVTEDGQVFDQGKMVSTLRWCDYTLKFHSKPNLKVSMKKETEEKWGFHLRVRLGANAWPRGLFEKSEHLVEPVLMFEPFFVYDLHPSVYAGIRTFGVAVGLDLTENLDVFGGAGARYKDAQIGPILGLSLSFN